MSPYEYYIDTRKVNNKETLVRLLLGRGILPEAHTYEGGEWVSSKYYMYLVYGTLIGVKEISEEEAKKWMAKLDAMDQ